MVPTEAPATTPSQLQPHWDLYPRTYVAQKTSFPLLDHLNGDLNKEVWSDVPWSEYFDDIRGTEDAPDGDRPSCRCGTRFKALWDDTHLFIGALLESDFETNAHFTERNSPIFQKDSDFEVFLDPLGSCHNYKELEINAINTVWNLLLDRPYADGGTEHSGRVARPGEPRYYEVYGQKTATQLVQGELNNPEKGATWSVELALSYRDILAREADNPRIPVAGSLWRINFSRVEKRGDINWTWQPQTVWNLTEKKFSDFVDMHRPDAWGYIAFGGAEGSSSPVDSSWPARLAAMMLYYAQKAYFATNSAYAQKLEDLSDLVSSAILEPFEIKLFRVQPETDDGPIGFMVEVSGNANGSIVTVSDDRFVRVEYPNLSVAEIEIK